MPAENGIPYDRIRAIEWDGDRIKLIDQRRLPDRLEYIYLDNLPDSARAIRDMVVRGAPAIGITAAYAVVLGARARYAEDPQAWRKLLTPDLELLATARPTAVNLRGAVERMRKVSNTITGDPAPLLRKEAESIHAEDIAAIYVM